MIRLANPLPNSVPLSRRHLPIVAILFLHTTLCVSRLDAETCGATMYNLTGLQGLSVQAGPLRPPPDESPLSVEARWTYTAVSSGPESACACDVIKVRVTIRGTVDKAGNDNIREDAVSIRTTADGSIFVFDSSCEYDDMEGFNPQIKTKDVEITLTSGDEVVLSMGSFDADSSGQAKAEIINAEIIQDSSCPDSTPGTGGCSPLGSAVFNMSAGLGGMGFRFETPDATMCTPAALRYNGMPATDPGIAGLANNPPYDVVVLNNEFRQFKVPTALFDIVIHDANWYQIKCYSEDSVGAKNGGLYTFTGEPYLIWTFSNHNQSASCDQLRVIERRGCTDRNSYLSYSDNTWSLTEGEGGDARTISRRMVESFVDSDGRKNEVIEDTVRNHVGSVEACTRQKILYIGNQRKVLERITDPYGEALTDFTWYDAIGFLMAVSNHTGYWEINYSWDGLGGDPKEMQSGIRPVGNTQFPASATNNPCVDVTPYRLIWKDAEEHYITYTRQRETERRQQSTVVRQTDTLNYDNGAKQIEEYGPGNDKLVTRDFKNDAGKVTVRPDGTVRIVSRVFGQADYCTTETILEGVPNALYTGIIKGSRTVRRTGPSQKFMSEYVYTMPEETLISSTVVTDADPFGRPQRIEYLDGTYELKNYTCCGIESQRSRDGTWTYYKYDSQKRMIAQTRAGMVTSNSYDAADRLVETWQVHDDTATLMSRNEYNVAGRLISSADTFGNTTYYSETKTPEGFVVRTTTHPDNSTSITRHYLDGTLESTYGTAVHPTKNEYGVLRIIDSMVYTYTKTYRLGPNGETDEWTMTLSDILGRLYQTIYPDGAYSFNVYNASNHLVRTQDPDGVTTLFKYNDLGEQEYSAIDMNDNLVMDLDGPDRVIRTVREYATRGPATVARTTSFAYPTTGSTEPVVMSINDASLASQESWSESFGRVSHTIRTWIDSTTRMETVVAPDGSYRDSCYCSGRLLATTNYTADSSCLGYTRHFFDTRGRETHTIDAQNRVASNVLNDAGQILESVLYVPGNTPRTNAYEYDDMGRVVIQRHPDNGEVRSEYYLTGELRKTWGARTYPVEYLYDSQGRMTNMVTWQDYQGLTGKADTWWFYDQQRGFMNAKVYLDNTTNSYTYSVAGRLKTRTWARKDQIGKHLVTKYFYDKAGSLERIQYPDATGSVKNEYDRMGRLVRTVDAAGDRRFVYNAAGQQTRENYAPGSRFVGMGVERDYDALGRLHKVRSLVAGTGTVGKETTYGYDTASRLKTVSFGSSTVTYNYLPDSSVVGSMTFNNGSADIMSTTKRYDGFWQLTNVVSLANGQRVSDFIYDYNLANQRTNCAMVDGSSWAYAYDPLGQLTNGTRRWSDGQEVDGQQYEYLYDDIGNRKFSRRGGATSTSSDYIANLLNQYTQRTVPGEQWIQGSANEEVTVDVNGGPATRHDAFFSRKLTLTNDSQAVYRDITVKATGMDGGNPVIKQNKGHVFTPRTPETFTYDADGNLTSDGRWSYVWDAENRLISMETLPFLATVPRQRLVFTYDAQCRRVRKQVFAWSGNGWASSADIWYVYDSWNLIREERRPDSQTRRVDMDYVWGIDLSGSMQGAGGIGGLVAVQSSIPIGDASIGNVVYTCYDANGNLTDLVSPAATPVAHYEYDPYGNTLVATGPAAKVNPFRFSTKYTDDETGWVYYGYRFYRPELGRWVNRDPMEERGSLSLYLFAHNTPAKMIDTLGLLPTSTSSANVRWFVQGMDADALSLDIGYINIAAGPRFIAFAGSFGAEFVYNCRSSEFAVLIYFLGGFSVGIPTPYTINVTMSAGMNFAYNLPTVAAYAGWAGTVELGGNVAWGGMYGRAFIGSRATGESRRVKGWGLGWQGGGMAGLGVTFSVGYSKIIAGPLFPGWRSMLCEQRCISGSPNDSPSTTDIIAAYQRLKPVVQPLAQAARPSITLMYREAIEVMPFYLRPLVNSALQQNPPFEVAR